MTRPFRITRALALVVALAIVAAVPLTASANGGGSTPACQASSVGPLGNAVQGAISTVVTDYNSITGVVDATMSILWQGRERVFRSHLGTQPIASPEELMCTFLAADPYDGDASQTLSQALGVATSALQITGRSVTNVNFNLVPPSSDTASGVADVVFYIVK